MRDKTGRPPLANPVVLDVSGLSPERTASIILLENPVGTVIGRIYATTTDITITAATGKDIILSTSSDRYVLPTLTNNTYLGSGSKAWKGIYVRAIFTDSAGGDIGSATLYFATIYIGQAYNSITGANGDMILRVKNTAGNGDVVALSILDGDNPIFSLESILYPTTPARVAQSASALFGGSGAPNNSNGNNGDIYFRSDGGALTTVYQRRAGAWVGIV